MKTNTPTKNEVKKANELVNKVVNKPKTKQLTLVQLQAQLAAKRSKTKQITEEHKVKLVTDELAYHDIVERFIDLDPISLDLERGIITFNDGSTYEAKWSSENDMIMIPEAFSPHVEYIPGYASLPSGQTFLKDPTKAMILAWDPPPAKIGLLRIGSKTYEIRLSQRGWTFHKKEAYFGSKG